MEKIYFKPKEKLPEYEKTVLVINKKMHQGDVRRIFVKTYFDPSIGWIGCSEVIAWRYLTNEEECLLAEIFSEVIKEHKLPEFEMN